jgi:hypothetical protein
MLWEWVCIVAASIVEIITIFGSKGVCVKTIGFLVQCVSPRNTRSGVLMTCKYCGGKLYICSYKVDHYHETGKWCK